MFMANVGIYLQNRKKMTKLIKDCQLFLKSSLLIGLVIHLAVQGRDGALDVFPAHAGRCHQLQWHPWFAGAVGRLHVLDIVVQHESQALIKTDALASRSSGGRFHLEHDGACQAHDLVDQLATGSLIALIGIDGQMLDVIKVVKIPVGDKACREATILGDDDMKPRFVSHELHHGRPFTTLAVGKICNI